MSFAPPQQAFGYSPAHQHYYQEKSYRASTAYSGFTAERIDLQVEAVYENGKEGGGKILVSF